jgi:galactokinase/mevalonate kinase-like predicted kinase
MAQKWHVQSVRCGGSSDDKEQEFDAHQNWNQNQRIEHPVSNHRIGEQHKNGIQNGMQIGVMPPRS